MSRQEQKDFLDRNAIEINDPKSDALRFSYELFTSEEAEEFNVLNFGPGNKEKRDEIRQRCCERVFEMMDIFHGLK